MTLYDLEGDALVLRHVAAVGKTDCWITPANVTVIFTVYLLGNGMIQVERRQLKYDGDDGKQIEERLRAELEPVRQALLQALESY